MEDSVFKAMEGKDDSWYYHGKRAAIASILVRSGVRARRVLDLGCGTGANAIALLPFLEPNAEYVGVEPHDMAFRPPPGLASRIVRARMEDLRSEDLGQFDVVMMLDVLEHVDEAMALETARRFLVPDGILLLTVPAYQSLWGRSDVDGHHRTRYTPRVLFGALERHDFTCLSWSHYFAFAFLPLLIVSWWQRREGARVGRAPTAGYFGPNGMDRLLVPLVRFEGFLGRFIHWPFGTGIVCLARVEKPQK